MIDRLASVNDKFLLYRYHCDSPGNLDIEYYAISIIQSSQNQTPITSYLILLSKRLYISNIARMINSNRIIHITKV